MGCGQEKVAENEDEWDALANTLHIQHRNWDYYSQEAKFAKAGWKEYSFTGTLLEKYVSIEMEFKAAKDTYLHKLNLLKQTWTL